MAPRLFTVTPNPGIDRTLTVPELLIDEVLRSTETRLDAGGKGFNVSRALAALGVPSVALAFLGGATGTLEAEMLRAGGIDVRAVEIADETRSCYVITEANGRHIKVNEPGPLVSAAEQEALLRLIDEEARPGDLWVSAGSLPRGVAADLHRRIVERVQARGGRAVLDAGGPALVEGLAARPFLIKPNALEAEQATGIIVRTPEEAAPAVRRLLERAEVVAISLGPDGMVAGSGAAIVHAQPPQIVARNTVGAGDATVAGMLDALAQDRPFAEIVRWAVACGTAAAMRPGVDFGVRAEVAAIAAQVCVRTLE